MLERGDSQDLKLPWCGRRVILIQCHLAHPSVWPWNPGICSLLLLGFVRWQAKTRLGQLFARAAPRCVVLRFADTRGCHMCFAKAFKDPGRGGQALAGATLFVEVDPRRGGDSVSQRNMLRALVSSPARAACVTFSQEAANSTAGVKVYREPLSDCMRLRRHESKVQTPRWTLNRSGSHLHAGHSGVKKFTQCLCVCTLIARKSRALEWPCCET